MDKKSFSSKLSEIKSLIEISDSLKGQCDVKIQAIFKRLELHSKTQIQIVKTDFEYSRNERKIYIHLFRLSNLWAIYEGVFDLLKNDFQSDIFLKSKNKGELVSGYTEKSSKVIIESNQFTTDFKTIFCTIFNLSKKYPHKDSIAFIESLEFFIDHLILENNRLDKATNNPSLQIIKNRLTIIKNYNISNYRKRTNLKQLEKHEQSIEWKEFLALIYSLRNHFYHNSLTGTESLTNKKSERFIVVFLLLLYDLFEEVLIFLLIAELNKKKKNNA